MPTDETKRPRERVADMHPTELRSIIQSGVMVGTLGTYALFAIVVAGVYVFGYLWTH